MTKFERKLQKKNMKKQDNIAEETGFIKGTVIHRSENTLSLFSSLNIDYLYFMFFL